MEDSLSGIPQGIRSEITGLLSTGNKIAAIKRYREATGADLKSARNTIDSFLGEQPHSHTNPLPVYTSSKDRIFANPEIEENFHRNEPLIDIPLSVRHEITALLSSSNKVAAIKRYREAAHCDLRTAKKAVEDYVEHLKNTNPVFAQQYTSSGHNGAFRIFALLAIVLIVAYNLPENLMPNDLIGEWKAKFDKLMQTAEQQTTALTGTTSTPATRLPAQANKAQADRKAPRPPAKTVVADPVKIVEGPPYQPIPPDTPADLTTLYRRKLANPDYVTWMSEPGLPKGYQDYIEEHHIKYVRAEIARKLTLPANTRALAIPVVADGKISIDGAIDRQEWQQAVRVALEPQATGSTLYLQADKDWLYLAADVPGDTTADGWDQFRFYIHVDTDPAIRNERIHVGRNMIETLGGIRQTTITWQGEPPRNEDERWKKYPISDWRIYRLAVGASTMQQHRQFEARLNLKESGLFTNTPFPVFVEIETDPATEGKYRKRMYLGGLGSQQQPVWMLMQ